MPVGLQIWDANGNLIVDVTTRLTRIINVVTLPGNSSGTIDLSSEPGDPWFRRSWQAVVTTGFASYPDVQIAGKTIQWNTTGDSSSTPLLYGVY